MRSASSFPVNVHATLILKSGVDIEEVTKAFQANLDEYFKSISLERFTVRYNRVRAILIATEGVVDYDSVVINGVEENLVLSTEQVPVVGEVVLE